MKNLPQSLLVTALAVLSLAAAGNLQAQGKLNDISAITVTFKLQLQSPGFNSKDGSVRTFDKPVVQIINTKNLLDRLALDKQAQGLYNSDKFPSGAKLALAGSQVVVVRGNNTFIVDVSDIVTFSGGTNDILSGTTNNLNGLADPRITELTLVRLNFDDTFIEGGTNLRFSIQGLDTIKTQDSNPGNNGNYYEKTTDNVKNAAGEGQSGGTPFVMTGSIAGNRSVGLTLAPPAS